MIPNHAFYTVLLSLYSSADIFIVFMRNEFRVLSNQEFKETYLPFLDHAILSNTEPLQLYTIEQYLKNILNTSSAYRTAFNFMIVVTKGVVVQSVNTIRYEVSPGQVMHVLHGDWTYTKYVSQDAEGFVVVYESNILVQYVLLYGNRRDLVRNPHIQIDLYDFQALIGSMLILNGELSHELRRPNVYLSLFYSILLRLDSYADKVIDKHNCREVEITYRFKDLVEEYHIINRSVGFYADKLCISDNYLNRCVKEVTGQSVKYWISKVNIQYSMLLLKNSARDITEIAYELNYPNPAYFSKVFKKIVGVSPTEYRNNSLDKITLLQV